MRYQGRHQVLNDYLHQQIQLQTSCDRYINRFWLVAHTRWGKELIGSVTPVGTSNIFTGLDGSLFPSLDKLLVEFANIYFSHEVHNTSSQLNGRNYFALFRDFKVYDKIEVLETETMFCDIPGMSNEV